MGSRVAALLLWSTYREIGAACCMPQPPCIADMLLNYRTVLLNCCFYFTAAQSFVDVECPGPPLHPSGQPKPTVFGWLFIANILLVKNGGLGQFALYHQHHIWLPCICPLCCTSSITDTCVLPPSNTGAATCTAPPTILDRRGWPFGGEGFKPRVSKTRFHGPNGPG